MSWRGLCVEQAKSLAGCAVGRYTGIATHSKSSDASSVGPHWSARETVAE